MPYVKPEIREQLDRGLAPQTAGDLNYCITKSVVGFLGPAPRYVDLDEAIGVLECAKLELYRRVAAPYEDKACEKNGDVY